MRISVAFNINFILFLVVLSLGGALGGYFIIDQRRTLSRELDRRMDLIGEYLVHDIDTVATRGDLKTMGRILQSAVLDTEVNYVVVKSLDGEILASRWDAPAHTSVREYTYSLRSTELERGMHTGDLFGSVSGPDHGMVIGHLSLGADLNPLQAKIYDLIARTAATVLLAVAVSLIAGYCYVRIQLRRSLSPLLSGIEAMSAGNLFRRIEPDRHREIEEIGRAFNEMAERLSATLISKGQLEAMVEQRTAELKAALDKQILAQADLAEREERIRLLLDSTAEAIYGIDLDGNCTFCNPACVRMLGYERPEDLIGKNMHDVIHHSKEDGSPYPVETCPIFAAFRIGKGNHVADEVFWKADGSSMHVEYWSYPVLRGEERQGAVVTFLDITDRMKLEQQFVQAQKLEGIGILAGGIAHDFNNMLSSILGYTEMALLRLDEGHPARSDLTTVVDSAKRAAELTRQILAFSRKQVMQMQALSLNSEILAAGKMIERLIGEDINVRLNLAADLPPIKADPTQMQQVLLNLAVNARDAMPGGGALTVETSLAEVDNPSLWLARGLAEDRYVLLSVNDTGIGMDEATRQRLFEPFFTTKEAGKGTGLGLSTVYGIVKQHGGDISVYSEPGRGTTFRIYLPLAAEAADRKPDAPPPSPVKGSGTILLVEDDETVRKFVTMTLTTYGYQVTSMNSGEDALDAVRRSAFDLVISDVIMPGMNGKALYRRITELRPGTRILYFSGYPAGSSSLNVVLDGGEPFLQKPFTIEALLLKVKETMAAPPARG